MCGGHSGRPAGPAVLRTLLGTTGFFVALAGAPLDLRAEDEEPPATDDDDSADDGDDTPEIDERAQVVERRLPTASDDLHADPASVVGIDLDDDSVPPATTLADVLDTVAGLHIRRLGGPGDPAYVTVRGSTSRQVEVWVDGVPLNAFGSAAVDLGGMALDAYDRVEIYRGFTPIELGAAPIGGLVHLTSRPGSAAPPRFAAGFGSFKTRFAQADGGDGAVLPDGSVGDVRLSVGYSGTEGDYPYFSDGGTLSTLLDDRTLRRGNNRSDALNVVGRARLSRGPLRLTLSDQLAWSDGGVPGPRTTVTTQTRFGVLDNLLSGTATLTPSPWLSARGELSWRLRRERYEDPLSEIGLAPQDRADLYHQPVGGLTVVLTPLPWLTVVPVVRTVVDVLEPVDLSPGDHDDSTRLRIGLSASLGASIEPWDERIAITPAIGLHVLDNRFLGDVPFMGIPIAGDGHETSVAAMPRIAVAFRPWPWLNVRAAASRGFRPPTFLELFGDRGGVVGNPTLRPETANTFDASVRVNGEPHDLFAGSAEVGYFRSDAVDRIIFVPNGQRVSIPTNFGASTIEGVEVAGQLRALRVIRAAVAVTHSRSEITDGSSAHAGNQLPYVPRWELDVSAGVALHGWLRLEWRFRFTAGTYDSRTNLFLQAPRPIHSLYARVQPGERWPWLSVQIDNLGDVTTFARFRDPLHPADDDRVVVTMEDFRGNPLPGRSFLLSLGWTAPPRRDDDEH